MISKLIYGCLRLTSRIKLNSLWLWEDILLKCANQVKEFIACSKWVLSYTPHKKSLFINQKECSNDNVDRPRVKVSQIYSVFLCVIDTSHYLLLAKAERGRKRCKGLCRTVTTWVKNTLCGVFLCELILLITVIYSCYTCNEKARTETKENMTLLSRQTEPGARAATGSTVSAPLCKKPQNNVILAKTRSCETDSRLVELLLQRFYFMPTLKSLRELKKRCRNRNKDSYKWINIWISWPSCV